MLASLPRTLPASLLALCALLAPGTAAATSVLLLGADDAAAVDAVETALLSTGNFAAADIGKRADTTTPALSELTPYDAVLVWNDDPWDDQGALGDVLNAFLAVDGGVVLGAHAMELIGEPLGAFSAAGDAPLLPGTAGAVAGDIDLGAVDLTHPLYGGVSAITFPDDGQGVPVVAGGAELLGSDTAGNPVVAAWCDRSVVAINVFPPSLPSAAPDVSLLFGNAISMTELDTLPVAAAGGPYTVAEGDSVGLDATATTDGDLGPVTWAWDVDADGIFGDLTGDLPTLSAAALDGPSAVPLAVRATDVCGRTSDASASLTVTNVLPAVTSVTNTGPVFEGTGVALEAVGVDVPGDPLTWSWTLGDATTDTGASITHVYLEDGSYTATATADDADGGTASGSTTVTVTNAPPSISSVTNDGPQGETQLVTFGVVASDPGGVADPLSYSWDFGDGTTGSGVAPTHPYADDGIYTATVTVSDDESASVSATTEVTVTNLPPVVLTVTSDSPRDEASVVTFSATASDPAGGLDPITWSWDFGDGTSGTGPAPTTIYADDGVYTVVATASDGDGGTATGSTTVTVNNVAPAVEAIVDDAPRSETQTVSFSVAATDVAGAADPLSYAWDFGDGATGVGSAASRAYADDGTYTVVVSVSDGDGGVTTSSTTVSISNVAPTLNALVGDTAGLVGQTLLFAASASDPAGAADPLSYAWDFGDGTSGSGASTTHVWVSPGAFTLSATVDDGDAGSATGSLPVTITNPGPTLTLDPAPAGILEGAAATLTATAADVLGGVVTLSWDWGDSTAPSTGLDLVSASHAWPDDGPWTVTVTATDTFGDSATASISVPVGNVAPTITSVPSSVAQEAVTYTVALGVSDPAGGADPPVWSLTSGPAGASITGSTLSWVPTYDQAEAGPLAIIVAVDDGDAGTDALTWTVDPDWTDADGDGLPDTWEDANGLDSSTDDSTADPDGDGLDNAAEYAGGTAPQGTNAPGTPVSVAPLGGASVFTVTPTLVFDDAVDPDGDVVTHQVEVYGDPSLVGLLDAASGLPTSTGQTSWTVTVPLPEDSLAWWRVRASDGIGFGPWTVAEELFVDASNSPPSSPTLLSPFEETVTVLQPTFVTGPVSDPEGDAITLLVRIEDSTGALFDTLEAVEQGDGSWRAASLVPLTEDAAWTWTAEAVDARGATAGPTSPVPFVIDVSNRPPTAPTFLLPGDGEVVDNALEVTLEAGTDPDADDDPLFVRLQADVEEGFIGADRQEAGPVETLPGAATTLALPELLPENRFVWLRARTEDDRGGASAWVARQVYVDGLPEPPSMVTIIAPTAEQVVEPEGLLVRWSLAVDPEEGALTYAVEVTAEGGADPVWSAAGLIADSEGEVTLDVSLDARAWFVRARATDVSGLDGEWSPAIRFLVLPGAGAGFDLGPGEGTGCSCSSRVDGRSEAPRRGWLLVALLVIAARRRPRRVELRSGLRRRARPAR